MSKFRHYQVVERGLQGLLDSVLALFCFASAEDLQEIDDAQASVIDWDNPEKVAVITILEMVRNDIARREQAKTRHEAAT
jgi:hypothetical protein